MTGVDGQLFRRGWCPTCRAQAPLLKDLAQQPDFAPVKLYIANYDTEKSLKKSLRVTKQSTIVVFKRGPGGGAVDRRHAGGVSLPLLPWWGCPEVRSG
jgi:thiol-disulfide isomerase/thioredoxin